MTFGQAISAGFANITNFEGRASRPAFWWWALLIFIIYVLAGALFGRGGGFMSFIFTIVWIVLALATIAVGCRRLHDTGRSGWWQLLFLLCGIGGIVTIIFWVQPGTAGANKYGPPPAE